jgi:hypothetical protein
MDNDAARVLKETQEHFRNQQPHGEANLAKLDAFADGVIAKGVELGDHGKIALGYLAIKIAAFVESPEF